LKSSRSKSDVGSYIGFIKSAGMISYLSYLHFCKLEEKGKEGKIKPSQREKHLHNPKPIHS